MRTELFDYQLPHELIATRPPRERDGGRMCIVERHGVRHARVRELSAQITENDLVVLNETRVRRARLSCRRPATSEGGGGGKVELLFLRPLASGEWEALGRANRPLREGDRLVENDLSLKVVGRGDSGTLFVLVEGDLEAELARRGVMPIPPYMERDADEQDIDRYQTVFAKTLGSAAAPTAGLHLTDDFLRAIEEKGARLARVLLHVGVGTFRPVTAEDLDAHPMHEEEIEVTAETASRVAETKNRGGRVIAIGTTVVRALESAVNELGQVVPTKKQTDLLIQPGYRFAAIDALLTNFHQPRSTLLALVSAFAGRERILSAYQEAILREYRFLSYGDAMWIPRAWAQGGDRG